jgi:2-succinyl-5-enolpyruvyl-6-hydroxy-3-cyclohexene-1-carboxylate synthase
LLRILPGSEPAIVRRVSETIPPGSFVYLGNSLPIREWNQFATFADRAFSIGESRGANGIDGQVASFLGWARREGENWAVIGDLTALYDLSALWALRHLDGVRLRIVVINNGGGRIFQRMFRNERFQNRHATGFEGWASMWGAEYCRELPGGEIGPAAVIELRPSEHETDAFWARLAEETRR